MEMPSTFTCISPLPFFSMSLLLLLLLPPLAVSLLLCCLGVAVVIRRGRAVTEVSVKEQAFQCPHCTLFQPNFSSSPYLSSPFNFPHRKRQFIIHRMSTVLIELTVDIKKKKKEALESPAIDCTVFISPFVKLSINWDGLSHPLLLATSSTGFQDRNHHSQHLGYPLSISERPTRFTARVVLQPKIVDGVGPEVVVTGDIGPYRYTCIFFSGLLNCPQRIKEVG